MRHLEVERDAEFRQRFPARAYTVAGWGRGVAWSLIGWEVEDDTDTEWSGLRVRTGRVVAVMVGDDRRFAVEVDEVRPCGSYCRSCGQVGCRADPSDDAE